MAPGSASPSCRQGPTAARENLKAGGFRTETELAWFTDALALIAIPEPGAAGHDDRLQISRHDPRVPEAQRAAAGPRRHPAPLPSRRGLRGGHDGEYLQSWLADDGAPRTSPATHSAATVPTSAGCSCQRSARCRSTGSAHAHRRRVRRGPHRERAHRGCARMRRSGHPEVRRRASRHGARDEARIRATIRSALADAEPDHLIAFNPAKAVRLPAADRPPPRVWTAERVVAFGKEYAEATKGMTITQHKRDVWLNRRCARGR